MNHRLLLCLVGLYLPAMLAAQDMHRLNYGVKGGFLTTLFTVNELCIEGNTISDISTQSGVSAQGTVFLRYNIGRQYLQAACTAANHRYTASFPTRTWYDYARPSDVSTISSQLFCIHVPLLYGYHLRQEGDYGMSLFAGPELCCLLPGKSSNTFTNFTQRSIDESVHWVYGGMMAGFSINIRHLFFDFTAEAGLGNISKQYSTIRQNGIRSTSDIVFNRCMHSLGFSVGFMF